MHLKTSKYVAGKWSMESRSDWNGSWTVANLDVSEKQRVLAIFASGLSRTWPTDYIPFNERLAASEKIGREILFHARMYIIIFRCNNRNNFMIG